MYFMNITEYFNVETESNICMRQNLVAVLQCERLLVISTSFSKFIFVFNLK